MDFSFLQSIRILNLATVVLGMLAGLYGFYGILGRPGGVLRQLLVAIPYGTFIGAATYVTDVITNELYSHTLTGILQVPVSSYAVGAIGFASAFALPFTSANYLHVDDEGTKMEPSVMTRILSVIVMAASGAFWFTIEIQTAIVQFHPFAGYRPPISVVVIVAALIGLLTGLYSSMYGSRGSTRSVSAADGQSRTSTAGCIFGCFVALLTLIPAGAFAFYFISLIGWSSLILLLVGVVAGVVLTVIQYWADHLPQRQLQYVSLVFFLCAGAIQIYEAVAL